MGLDGYGIYNDFDHTLQKGVMRGYIVIPDDIERDKFIEQCLRTERFSVQLEGSIGVFHNCYATKSTIRDIVFPKGNEKIGSGVVFFVDSYIGKAIIIGVVSKNDEVELNKQNVSLIKKGDGDNYAILTVDGSGQINIDVIGTAGKGKFNINVRNDDSTAEVNIKVKGSVNIYTEGDTNITAVDGDVNIKTNQDVNVEASTGDIHISNDKSNISITDSGIDINSDKEISIAGGIFNVLYSMVPNATSIVDVSEIGVSQKVKVG